MKKAPFEGAFFMSSIASVTDAITVARELAPARLRSCRQQAWGRFAAQREQASSPQNLDTLS
jgi:hypothetical protein